MSQDVSNTVRNWDKHYLYVKVIEARNVVVRGRYYISEPFAAVRFNGRKMGKNYRVTKCKMGRQWWDQTFRFKTKTPMLDWVTLQIRERGFHLVRSDWVGEITVRVRDFIDEKPHEYWFELTEAPWKRHRRKAKGQLHVAFHLMRNKIEKPFTFPPVEPQWSYEEWRENGGAKAYDLWRERMARKAEENKRRAEEAFRKKQKKKKKKPAASSSSSSSSDDEEPAQKKGERAKQGRIEQRKGKLESAKAAAESSSESEGSDSSESENSAEVNKRKIEEKKKEASEKAVLKRPEETKKQTTMDELIDLFSPVSPPHASSSVVPTTINATPMSASLNGNALVTVSLSGNPFLDDMERQVAVLQTTPSWMDPEREAKLHALRQQISAIKGASDAPAVDQLPPPLTQSSLPLSGLLTAGSYPSEPSNALQPYSAQSANQALVPAGSQYAIGYTMTASPNQNRLNAAALAVSQATSHLVNAAKNSTYASP